MIIEDFKARKKAVGATTMVVADYACLPYSTVSKVFTGETKNPSRITIEKIDAGLARLECAKRLEIYRSEMSLYFEEHPLDSSEAEFQQIYRQRHDLDDAPIMFAKKKDGSEVFGYLVDEPEKSPPLKGYSVEEYFALETDRCTQLIHGELFVADYPTIEHQIVCHNLGRKIENFIVENHGTCKVFSEGINLQPNEDDNSVFGPDVVVVCPHMKRDELKVIGGPDLIMEVTSPSTRYVDYHDKLTSYIQAGVYEYWIVDLQKNRVVVNGCDREIPAIYSFEEDIPVGIYEGKLTIRMEEMLV